MNVNLRSNLILDLFNLRTQCRQAKNKNNWLLAKSVHKKPRRNSVLAFLFLIKLQAWQPKIIKWYIAASCAPTVLQSQFSWDWYVINTGVDRGGGAPPPSIYGVGAYANPPPPSRGPKNEYKLEEKWKKCIKS